MGQHRARSDAEAELAGETARMGALLRDKGLTPDQIATVMRDVIQPALDEEYG